MKSYTVTEYGFLHEDGYVESLGIGQTPVLQTFRALVGARLRREEIQFVSRTVTGHDPAIDTGLLSGAPLRLKNGMPTVVESMTGWEPVR